MSKPIEEMTAQELQSERRTVDEMIAWGKAQPRDDFTRYNEELVEAIFAGRGELELELDIEDDDTPDEQPAEQSEATLAGGFYRP